PWPYATLLCARCNAIAERVLLTTTSTAGEAAASDVSVAGTEAVSEWLPTLSPPGSASVALLAATARVPIGVFLSANVTMVPSGTLLVVAVNVTDCSGFGACGSSDSVTDAVAGILMVTGSDASDGSFVWSACVAVSVTAPAGNVLAVHDHAPSAPTIAVHTAL